MFRFKSVHVLGVIRPALLFSHHLFLVPSWSLFVNHNEKRTFFLASLKRNSLISMYDKRRLASGKFTIRRKVNRCEFLRSRLLRSGFHVITSPSEHLSPRYPRCRETLLGHRPRCSWQVRCLSGPGSRVRDSGTWIPRYGRVILW